METIAQNEEKTPTTAEETTTPTMADDMENRERDDEAETTTESKVEGSTASIETTESTESTQQQVETNVDVFTQEEPDDVEEAWSYIGGQYTVKQGDTLAGISKKIYQSYDYISLLAEANQIENVDQIYPGQVLDIPPIED